VRCGASAVLTHLAERAGLPVVAGAMAKGVIIQARVDASQYSAQF
jgi:hypothetical protein